MRNSLMLLIVLLLAACQAAPATPAPPTPLIIVRQLATVGPTQTPNATDLIETRQAATATPTAPLPTASPSPTPYIGVFIGEAESDLLNPPVALPRDNNPTPGAIATVPLACPFAPDAVFGTEWQEEARVFNSLGCPIQQSFGFVGVAQVFERGVMYWNQQTNEVWAVEPSTNFSNGQYWYVDRPPETSTIGMTAPEGLTVPGGVIGSVWAGFPSISEAMGFARTQEQPAGINLQRFDGGTLLLDLSVGQVFALLVNGEAYGPYQ